MSPGSAINDRVTKLGVYAAAGIEHYWVLDLPAGVAACYILGDGAYRLLAEGPTIQTSDPVAIQLDVASLTRP